MQTNGAHIYRALMEAICYGARSVADLFAAGELAADRVILTSGLARRNPLLVQIMADVLGRGGRGPRDRARDGGGAAIHGAVAAGIVDGYAEGAARFGAHTSIRVDPRAWIGGRLRRALRALRRARRERRGPAGDARAEPDRHSSPSSGIVRSDMYLNRLRLDGRVAFITGAARGMGLCSAEALAEAGARVVISDLGDAALAEAQAALAAKGHQVGTAVLDITDASACTEVAARLNRDVGPVEVLIANAGIAWKDTGAEEMDDAAWLRVIDVDLNGAFWTCRAFGTHMLGRRRGAIVTVGSMSGFISNKPQGQVHYNAAKAGLHHMTRSLAGEWAERGVRVNGVAPGYVNTAMTNVAAKDPRYLGPWMEVHADAPDDRARGSRRAEPLPRLRRLERDDRLDRRHRWGLHRLVGAQPGVRL